MVIDLSLITTLAAAIIEVRGGANPEQLAEALEDARAWSGPHFDRTPGVTLRA